VSVTVVTGAEDNVLSVIKAQLVVNIVESEVLSVVTAEKRVTLLASDLRQNWVLALLEVRVENQASWAFALLVDWVVALSKFAANDGVVFLAVVVELLPGAAEDNVVSSLLTLESILVVGNDVVNAGGTVGDFTLGALWLGEKGEVTFLVTAVGLAVRANTLLEVVVNHSREGTCQRWASVLVLRSLSDR
jgi:hypothetical protein